MSARIREHMEVVGSDGVHVGTVDRLERGHVRIAKGDSVDGRHRLIPGEWVERIDDKVHLNRSSADAIDDLGTAFPGGIAAGDDRSADLSGVVGAVLFPDEPPHER